jgi:oligopeptidase B
MKHRMTIPVFLAAAIGLSSGCGSSQSAVEAPLGGEAAAVEAPIAERRPVELEMHGHVRIDDYYWMRDREDEAVIRYLEAENAYTDAVLAHTEALQERIFEEIRGRIVEDDSSVPYKLRDYWYYTRQVEGKDYPIYARKKGSLDAPEEIMLDVNELAEGHSFYQLMGLSVSEGQDLLAFAADTVGRRVATIYFRNLETGEILDTQIPHVTGNMAWAADNKTLFYSKQDPQTLRSYQIYRYELGTDPAEAELVYEEEDDTFITFVSRTRSRDYLMIGSHQTVSNEYRYLRADQPTGDWQVLIPRERHHEYQADHFGEHFYILTNDEAKNFRLMRTPVANPGRATWEEVIAHRDDTYLGAFTPFADHLVVSERRNGLGHLRIMPWEGASEGESDHYIELDDPTYRVSVSANPEFDTSIVRFEYSSLTTPNSVYDYDMNSRERTLLKRDEVLGGFDPSEYEAERVYATARDGTRVPVSLVYRKDMRGAGPQPLLLYAYGSYGISIDASFSSIRLSLLDRGFIYAIAHIRGGQEMGRDWYEGGKMFNKWNTFHDFIDVGEHLVRAGYTEPGHLYGMGGSAGGLLMGAVINERPDLFHGVIAAVPFVDVVTTMLDDSIPLTTGEYDEWGNPNEQESYEYMLSYSPYDNVREQAYPHMLVLSGLHDSQVQYWEPTKWVAKLRQHKTDDNRLLLKTNMEAGHGGASGRYRRWREIALEYAFLLDLAGLADEPPRGASGAVVDGH